jgi:hypothetical protein
MQALSTERKLHSGKQLRRAAYRTSVGCRAAIFGIHLRWSDGSLHGHGMWWPWDKQHIRSTAAAHVHAKAQRRVAARRNQAKASTPHHSKHSTASTAQLAQQKVSDITAQPSAAQHSTAKHGTARRGHRTAALSVGVGVEGHHVVLQVCLDVGGALPRCRVVRVGLCLGAVGAWGGCRGTHC